MCFYYRKTTEFSAWNMVQTVKSRAGVLLKLLPVMIEICLNHKASSRNLAEKLVTRHVAKNASILDLFGVLVNLH